jgi:hypothetical protein
VSALTSKLPNEAYLNTIMCLCVLADRLADFRRRAWANVSLKSVPANSPAHTYFCDMLSTPTATPSSASPAWIECAMFRMAISPEEQSRLTVWMGTLAGMPAASAAARDTYSGEGGWHVPTSS